MAQIRINPSSMHTERSTAKGPKADIPPTDIKIFDHLPDDYGSGKPAPGAVRTVVEGNVEKTYTDDVLTREVERVMKNGEVIAIKTTEYKNGTVIKTINDNAYQRIETINKNDTRVEKEYLPDRNGNKKLTFETEYNTENQMVSKTQYFEDGAKCITTYNENGSVDNMYDSRNRLIEYSERFNNKEKVSEKKEYSYYGNTNKIKTITTKRFQHNKVSDINIEEFKKSDNKTLES